MKSTCPHCSKVHKIPEKYRDQKIKCPTCAQPFVVKQDEEKYYADPPQIDNRLPGEPSRWSAWYGMGILAPIVLGYGSEGSALGVVGGLGLLFFCFGVGNILYELRVIVHYHRHRRP